MTDCLLLIGKTADTDESLMSIPCLYLLAESRRVWTPVVFSSVVGSQKWRLSVCSTSPAVLRHLDKCRTTQANGEFSICWWEWLRLISIKDVFRMKPVRARLCFCSLVFFPGTSTGWWSACVSVITDSDYLVSLFFPPQDESRVKATVMEVQPLEHREHSRRLLGNIRRLVQWSWWGGQPRGGSTSPPLACGNGVCRAADARPCGGSRGSHKGI